MSAQVVRRVQYSMLGVLAAVVASSLYGCAEESAPHPFPPEVEITSGPIEGGTVSYAILIAWEGSDPDGFVEHFEYVVDPPPGFTEAEIEGEGETVNVETIPGENSEPDVTRISKVVDGEVISFDWVHTREFSRHFRFATPDADSSGETGQPTGRFTGMHAVYVRAVDNEGLYSIPDKVAFTAETVAPTATIVRPDISGSSFINAGNFMKLAWEAIDPDGPDPTRFLFKAIRLDTIPRPPFCIWTCSGYERIIMDYPWTELEGNNLDLSLDVPADYLVGLRAIDEAGAIEPFVEFRRNLFLFRTSEGGGVPQITIDCDGQILTFPTPGTQTIEVVAGREITCTISCNAESYGEQCSEWRWGVDVPDLDVGPWNGWTTNPTFTIQFDRPGIDVLYVQARDALGNTAMATVIMNVVEFPFDREILYVDDSFDDLYPRDNEHDEFWRDRIINYGGFSPEDVGEHHAHLDNDRGALSPVEPLLEDLGRYKMVLWECRGSGYNGATALLKSTETSPILASYLKAGGKLWLGGRMTVAATMATASGLNADLVYPKTNLSLLSGNFAYDFLKLHSSKINNDKAKDPAGRHNIAKAIPFPGRPEIYPEMTVDISKLNPAAQSRGVSHADAVFDPLFAHSEPAFLGVIDSLYVYGSTAVHLLDPPSNSSYENRLTAIRWHDPDPAREHGRVQWFGFPLYFFENSQAQETFNRSMDWFREEGSPALSLRKTRP